ncbi:hypothetical protein ACQKFG_22355 [Peribacillus sp. NPDC076916]|uniref:hypothetical protein n=1 Tax=Peribacillus sp. NPDC076916 TaxID=3390608 RepID=UPI003CFF9F28
MEEHLKVYCQMNLLTGEKEKKKQKYPSIISLKSLKNTVTYHEGIKLMEQAVADQLKVVMTTKLNIGIKHVSLPVAYLPGDTEEFILLSGHNHSWYKGATDNAGGNRNIV